METEETRMTETRKQELYGPPLPTAGAPGGVLDLLDHIEESDWGKL